MAIRKSASLAERVSSREAVEAAIEKSKDDRGASWEKPTHAGVETPKWGEAERGQFTSTKDCGC
jgi:hypothetical protein